MYRLGYKKLSQLTDDEAVKAVEYGLKPLALVTEQFDTHLPFISFKLPYLQWQINDGRNVITDLTFQYQYVYYNPDQEFNAQRLAQLSIRENRDAFHYQIGDVYDFEPMRHDYHREIGTLLGYTSDEIESFLQLI